jgi:hypothetical protein
VPGGDVQFIAKQIVGLIGPFHEFHFVVTPDQPVRKLSPIDRYSACTLQVIHDIIVIDLHGISGK